MTAVLVLFLLIFVPIAACWYVLFKYVKPMLEQHLETFPYCCLMLVFLVISVFPGWNLLMLLGFIGYHFLSKNYRK